jgi:hypothetical protein
MRGYFSREFQVISGEETIIRFVRDDWDYWPLDYL